MEFKLDPRLDNDCIKLTSFELCELLMMNDSQYPWLILVPRVINRFELFQLTAPEQKQYQAESNFVSQMVMNVFTPDKLNIAALGNVVKQLHIHHVARFESDVSWPGPIWGAKPVVAYNEEALDVRVGLIGKYLKDNSVDYS